MLLTKDERRKVNKKMMSKKNNKKNFTKRKFYWIFNDL